MTDNKLLAKHPELKDALKAHPDTRIYEVLKESGRIQEYWERDEDGNWTDQTEREKIREQIEDAIDELERLKNAVAREKAKAEENL